MLTRGMGEPTYGLLAVSSRSDGVYVRLVQCILYQRFFQWILRAILQRLSHSKYITLCASCSQWALGGSMLLNVLLCNRDKCLHTYSGQTCTLTLHDNNWTACISPLLLPFDKVLARIVWLGLLQGSLGLAFNCYQLMHSLRAVLY